MKQTAIKAAEEAGKLLMENFENVKKVNIKGDGKKKSLVTNVDFQSDNLIKKIILGRFPEHNIITEETEKIENNSEYTWHIDPIDGTHNYLNGLPLFGVSIALEHKDEIILGVINLPKLKKMYIAENGKGAFCNNGRIKVSAKNELDFSLCVIDFNYPIRDKSVKFVQSTKKHLVDFRNFGCAVFALASLANGNIDSYVSFRTNSWDVAAGFLMVEEAGGRVTSLKGGKWGINEHEFLATNGKLHEELLKLID